MRTRVGHTEGQRIRAIHNPLSSTVLAPEGTGLKVRCPLTECPSTAQAPTQDSELGSDREPTAQAHTDPFLWTSEGQLSTPIRHPLNRHPIPRDCHIGRMIEVHQGQTVRRIMRERSNCSLYIGFGTPSRKLCSLSRIMWGSKNRPREDVPICR